MAPRQAWEQQQQRRECYKGSAGDWHDSPKRCGGHQQRNSVCRRLCYKRLLLCNKAMEQQPRHPAHTRHGLCGEREWLRSLSPWEDPVLCLVWMALPKLCTSVCQPKMDLDLLGKTCLRCIELHDQAQLTLGWWLRQKASRVVHGGLSDAAQGPLTRAVAAGNGRLGGV